MVDAADMVVEVIGDESIDACFDEEQLFKKTGTAKEAAGDGLFENVEGGGN